MHRHRRRQPLRHGVAHRRVGVAPTPGIGSGRRPRATIGYPDRTSPDAAIPSPICPPLAVTRRTGVGVEAPLTTEGGAPDPRSSTSTGRPRRSSLNVGTGPWCLSRRRPDRHVLAEPERRQLYRGRTDRRPELRCRPNHRALRTARIERSARTHSMGARHAERLVGNIRLEHALSAVLARRRGLLREGRWAVPWRRRPGLRRQAW